MMSRWSMLTRKELDVTRCDVPGCTDCSHLIYLQAICHPKAALGVAYDKDKGCMVVLCHQCRSLVALVEVAAGKQERIQ